MRTKLKLLACLSLSLLLTSCASRPVPNQCPKQQVYPRLQLPEPGHFRQKGREILEPSTPGQP